MFFKLTKLLKIISQPYFINALFKGAAAGVEHKPVLKMLGEIRHVVDIGANRGQFALMARKCFPEALIDSFEPLAEPGQIYQAVFSGDMKARLHDLAIGPQKGNAVIHVSNRDDSSSLLPIDGEQTNLFPETSEKETRVIKVSALDDVFKSTSEIISPSLLKIDVQGYELSTLNGCASLLGQFKYIYVECSFVELYTGQSLVGDVIRYLADHDFRLVGVHNIFYGPNGKSIQADFLFQNLNAIA